jgi:probable rRNA maturation factor
MTVTVELVNRSGADVAAEDAIALARRVLSEQGIDDGDLGIAFVDAEEMRTLKRDHLGIDEPTDVLSFPIDASEELRGGVPRQLGDVVLCPAVVGEAWRRPLVHGLLHLLGHDHGPQMDALEEAWL